jgi:Integrase
MASLHKQKTPTGEAWRIQFSLNDERKSIFIGKSNKKTAETICSRVETIDSCNKAGIQYPSDVAQWLGTISDDLHEKLATVGLVRPRESAQLKPFIDRYVAGRNDVKPATKEVWRQGISGLVEFFGETKRLQDIGAGDADDYKQFLIGKGLAPYTIRKRLQFANTIFIAAQRRGVIAQNPFSGVTVQATMNDERQRFITLAETERIIAKCPNHHWRLIVALTRFAGLRCPNEVLSLKWTDVDWERGEITITANKTAHHAGKGIRRCPLFPQLRLHLEESFEMADEGAVYVIDESFRKGAIGKNGWRNCNLRTTFEKIIRRAGIEPWPKPFVNLRSTCETELNEQFPSHVVANWLGHSVKIATKHYLQVTDEHLARALEFRTKTDNSNEIDVTSCEQKSNRLKKVSLNASLSASAGGGNGLKTTENDISAKKQKQAVTSLTYKGLQPVANSYRICAEFSKNGLADGEDFELWNPRLYSCPSDPRRKENCHTNWAMVVGENTISNGPGTTTLNDITDDKATTILLIETTRPISWMAPEDLTLEDLEQGITQPHPKNPDVKASSYHSPGIRVRCLDGSPRTLPDSISPETLKAMATINGGEKIVLP